MRKAEITRATKETQIKVIIDLDGTGICALDTKMPFFEHMLEQIAKHSKVDLQVSCSGDIHIDYHHSVEDIGIAIGKAFLQAVGDKTGINRYATFYAPLDESLARCVIDISGRTHLNFNVNFSKDKVGDFETELVKEFFVAFTQNAFVTLHIDLLRGENTHHQIEAIFKAFAKCLRIAIALDEQFKNETPSTKGLL